jgi:4-amino-4-deoxy-L-arabinose transferase-like glycosyltransferase
MPKDISLKKFQIFIAGLIIIRIILVVLMMYDIPPSWFVGHWPKFEGGDEEGYFQVAKYFSEFTIKDYPGYGTIGGALVYVPYIWATNAKSFMDFYNHVFFVQAFIMYPIAIFCVAYIAKKVFKNNLLGIAAGAIFVFYPYLLYALNLGPYEKNYVSFMMSTWSLAVLTDPPSAFFTYLSAAMFLKAYDGSGQKSKKYYVLSGLAGGFAALVRITNIFICAAIGAAILAKRKFKPLVLFAVTAGMVFSLQLLFNFKIYGDFFHFGQYNADVQKALIVRYETKAMPGKISKVGFLKPDNYFYLLTVMDKYVPHLSVVLAVSSALLVLDFWYLFKRNRFGAFFILVWFLSYSIFYSMYAPAARNIRYWMPMFPALIILIINFSLMIYRARDYFQKHA